MSDINRVPLTYGSQSVSNKTKNVIKKTVRIVVTLPQSNEDTCPEYNYKDELDAAKKRSSIKNTENGGVLDMFGDDDGDVRRIAMEMEEKYGKGVSVVKKKRRGRKDDYADIGMGYDESDSFIDNTHGYDEIIPQNVSTLHGGFYINCGALEFKTDDEASDGSSSSSSSSSSPAVKNNKKRTIESDDSEAEADQHEDKKQKLDHNTNGMQKAIKKKLFSPNKILKKRRSSEVLKKTVRDLLKEKRQDLNLSVYNSSETDVENSVLKEGEANNVENGKSLSSSITDAIESVVKAAEEPVEGASRLSSQSEARPTQLPENLPNNISEVITKITQASIALSGSNKFPDEINNLLLSLERKCKYLGKPSKNKVYEHLSYFMKVEKQVLIQQCRKLALKDEEKKIKSLLNKLKGEIDKVMPSILDNYQKECDLVNEKKTLLQQQSDGDNEKRKSIGKPKRKFRWNDQTRKFLKDTATIKKRSYLQQGNSKDTWEDELTNFLKNRVLNLWPEGWMTMTSLTKACNKLFNDPKTVNQPPSLSKKETVIQPPSISKKETANQPPSISKKETVNQPPSMPKKENKTTASNTPQPPYPSNPITYSSIVKTTTKTYSDTSKAEKSNSKKEEIVHNLSNPVTYNATVKSSTKTYSEMTRPDRKKEENVNNHIENVMQLHKEKSMEKNKTEVIDSNSDKKNNNGSTFIKIDYDKSQVVSPSLKDSTQGIKQASTFPNVSVIEVDSPNSFINLLPKHKLKPKSELEYSKSNNPLFRSISSDNSIRGEKRINVIEVGSMDCSQENHRAPSDSDEIQNVMERLKTLQKMSSPVKTFEGSSSSNTSFSQKSSSVLKNNIDLVTSSFQDEFQKQLLNLGNLAPNSSKSNYKCS